MFSERKRLERWRRLLGPGDTAGDLATRAGDGPDCAGGRTIRVALVDPHPIAREGVRLLLEPAGDIQVVGMADDGAGALRLVAEQRPRVLLLEPRLPDMEGAELARQVVACDPEVALLALAATLEAGEARRLLQLGVQGYLSKRASGEQLAAAVRAAAQGLAVLGSWAARIAFQRDGPSLSARQQQVLDLLLAGRRYDEIAEALCVSQKTVEFHAHNLLAKRGAHSRGELLARAGRRT